MSFSFILLGGILITEFCFARTLRVEKNFFFCSKLFWLIMGYIRGKTSYILHLISISFIIVSDSELVDLLSLLNAVLISEKKTKHVTVSM